MTSTDVPQPLFCRSFGSGPRQILALHCTMGHSGAWRGLAAAMEPEVTIHAADMLNHGRSPDWDGAGDFHDRMVAAAAQLLTQPMDLVGHSLGATIALRVAIAKPELVRSLTLMEPVLLSVARQDAPALAEANQRKSEPFHKPLRAGDFEEAARAFNRDWGVQGGPRWPEMPEQTRNAMIRGVRVVTAGGPAVYEDRPGLMKPGGLDRANMPVLLLRGADTEPVIAAVNDGLVRRLKNARNVSIPGAGHMLPITHPALTAEALRAFFPEIAESPA